MPGLHVSAGNRAQLQFHFADEPGQTHSTHGCPEDLRIRGRRTIDRASPRYRQLDGIDVVAERAIAMVILAMNVGRHRTAEGNEACPRSHWQKPPTRHNDAQQIVQADARLGAQHPTFGIEDRDSVQPFAEKHMPTLVEGGVAVTPSQPAGDGRLYVRRELSIALRSMQGADLSWIIVPRGHGCNHCRQTVSLPSERRKLRCPRNE
jgi:hypothetical protein